MNEIPWTRMVCDKMTKDGGIIITPITQTKFSHHGISDRHINSKKWWGWVEFKGVKTKVTPTQQYFMACQNRVRIGSAFIWRQVDDSITINLQYCKTRTKIIDFGEYQYRGCIDVMSTMQQGREI